MRIELWLIIIIVIIIANIYTEGKYVKDLMKWKKYYQMAGVAVGGLVIYWLIKKSPEQAQNILHSSNEYIKYLPIDRSTSNLISPILNFTARNNFKTDKSRFPIINMNNGRGGESMMNDGIGEPQSVQQQRIIQSSDSPILSKRNVSESKKKFVAARQKWCCMKCKSLLDSTFEIDHIIRLDSGGSNHVDNLQALCPGCHRSKTQLENMSLMG